MKEGVDQEGRKEGRKGEREMLTTMMLQVGE
jgi:hypothetical protein